jgi:hypothetical protein
MEQNSMTRVIPISEQLETLAKPLGMGKTSMIHGKMPVLRWLAGGARASIGEEIDGALNSGGALHY